MTEATVQAQPSRLAIAATLGAYAAILPLASTTTAAIALIAPLIAIPLCFWSIAKPARWVGLFLLAAILLPPLPFPIGDSGVHPALAIAGLGLFAGLLRLNEWELQADALNLGMFAFLCALLISIVPAAMYSGVAIAAASFARVCLFGVSIYVFLYIRNGPAATVEFSQHRQIQLLFFAAVAAAIFACLDFYFQFPAPAGFGRQFVWLDTGVFRRAQGLFYEASTLGNFCAFFLVMIGVSILRPPAERPLPRNVLLIGAAAFSASLVLSYSRASLVSLAIAAATILLLNWRRLKLKRLAVLFALGLPICAVLTFGLFPAFAELYWLRLSASAQYFFSAPEVVLSGRIATWKLLLNFIAEHPWHAIIGVGYKTLPYSDFIGQPIVADNMYLSLLVETGIVGLSALLLLSALILRAALRAAKNTNRQRAFFGEWFFCFWIGQMFQMFSGDLLTYWRVLPVYFWVLAMAVRK